MRNIDESYRVALVPYLTDLAIPGNKIDLNLAEEILSPLGLRDLNRAERIVRHLMVG